MTTDKRLKILLESEITELYSPPALALQDQRFYFMLNDIELAECKKIRERNQRCMFVVLLGYFKIKPVPLIPRFHQVKHDLKFVSSEILPGSGCKPFNLSHKERARVYQRIFKLTGYKRWDSKLYTNKLMISLTQTAHAWNHPRALFDSAIEYLSTLKIAIPGYTTFQDLISDVVNNTNDQLAAKIESTLSVNLIEAFSEFTNDKGVFTLRQLRQAAKNFTQSELRKELNVLIIMAPRSNDNHQTVNVCIYYVI